MRWMTLCFPWTSRGRGLWIARRISPCSVLYRPNSTRSTEDYDSVVFEPFRPDGFEGDIEEIELPSAIDENRELAELVVSVATEPYMDPDKAVGREQSIDSLCDEKTEVSESMRYGMEGVGLPMLDAAEHLANY